MEKFLIKLKSKKAWKVSQSFLENWKAFHWRAMSQAARKLRVRCKTYNKQRQSDSQRYAPFVLLAGAQTLTQKALRAGCACAGR
ncbi:hypothetical protein ACFQH7_17235 [Microbulbifer taiwanensis]